MESVPPPANPRVGVPRVKAVAGSGPAPACAHDHPAPVQLPETCWIGSGCKSIRTCLCAATSNAAAAHLVREREAEHEWTSRLLQLDRSAHSFQFGLDLCGVFLRHLLLDL